MEQVGSKPKVISSEMDIGRRAVDGEQARSEARSRPRGGLRTLGMSSRLVSTLIPAALSSLCALVGVLVLLSGSARAAFTHEFLPKPSAAIGEGAPEGLPEPHSMTVDSGELFLAGGGAEDNRLLKFDAFLGAFLSQFPAVPSLFYLHQGVAVGHATGEPQVFIGGDVEGAKGAEGGALGVFDASGAALAEPWKGAHTASGGFGCFECDGAGDVAVDNSPSLSWPSGDVYVADPEHAVVDVFKPGPSGEEPAEVAAELTGIEPFSRPTHVAVSAFNGDVLFVEREGVVDIFKPAALTGQYEFVQQLTKTPQGSFGKIDSLTVDGSNGDIYVADSGSMSSTSSTRQATSLRP